MHRESREIKYARVCPHIINTTISLSYSLRRASARPEVEPAGGLAPHRGNDCSQAVPRHVLEPDATLGVDRLLVGTPTRLALQVSE